MRAFSVVAAWSALLCAMFAPLDALAALALGACETFESGFGGNWTTSNVSGNGAAGTSTQATSPTYSLYTRSGGITVTSNTVNLSSPLLVNVSVWVRRGGSFSSKPEVNENFIFEYLATGSTWATLETFTGGGTAGEIFARTYSLPSGAYHSGFRVRFRQTGGSGNGDYWHADNVCLSSVTPVSYSFEETTWSGAAGEVKDDGWAGLDGTATLGAATANATPAVNTNPGTCRYGTFDGNNDKVTVPDNAALDIPNELTVTAWIYQRSTPTEYHTIVSKDTNYEFHTNSSNQIYWWWNGPTLTTGTSITNNAWHHVAVTYRSGQQYIYVDGVQRAASTQTGTLPQNTDSLFIGTDLNIDARTFDGYIDEVRIIPRFLSQAQIASIMSQTHPCANLVQFTINHDTFGINCVAETITVNVIDAVAGTPRTDYNSQIQLETRAIGGSLANSGTWALVTGSGMFSDGAAGDGIATYTWPLGQSQAVFTLYYPQGPAAIDIEAFQVSNTGVRDNDAQGNLVFYPNGFTVTANALSNPPGAIAPFAANQTAGTSFTLNIAAYGQTASDPVCGIIEAYDGDKLLEFWSQYSNPSSGTLNVAITTVAAPVTTVNAAATEAAATGQTVRFTSGRASVVAKYKDVGQIRIFMKDDTAVNAVQLPGGIRGATANFVVRPYDFVLSNIRNSAGTVVNPAASNAAGTVFLAAGAPFRATVTVRDSEGTTTPNYGRETGTPDYVRLIPTLFAPTAASGAVNPAISPAPPTNGFGAFTNGVATGTGFAWSEVGIIRLRGGIGDSDYLGAGDVIGPTQSERVGRFIPHRFNASLNAPTLVPACAAGGFTYQGQPFSYGTVPVITATAVALGGSPTVNYTNTSDGWFKLTNASLANKTYSSLSAAAIDASGVSGTDPVVANAGSGIATLTFGSGSGLLFTRSQAAPFAAGVQLSIDVIDADGVTTATAPTTFGTSGGITFLPAGDSIRYGRVRVATALGSERVDLPVKMVSEYYLSSAAGFVTNAADTCSTNVTLALQGYTENLAAGETCVRDSGSPGSSGVGCAAPAASGLPYTEPPGSGDFNLRLAAPGVGNTGSVLINGDVPTWLRFDWNTATLGDENPRGQATFGLFGGESRQIYLREIY